MTNSLLPMGDWSGYNVALHKPISFIYKLRADPGYLYGRSPNASTASLCHFQIPRAFHQEQHHTLQEQTCFCEIWITTSHAKHCSSHLVLTIIHTWELDSLTTVHAPFLVPQMWARFQVINPLIQTCLLPYAETGFSLSQPSTNVFSAITIT